MVFISGLFIHYERYVWLYRTSTSNPVFMIWPNRWVLMKMDVWETNVLLSGVTQQCESRWMIWIFPAWAGESHNWADDIWDEPHEKGANALDPAEPIWQLENKLPVENSAISAHVTAVSISLPFIHATAAWTFSRRQWLKMFTQHFLPVYDCLFFFWCFVQSRSLSNILSSIKNPIKLKGQSSKR